MNKMTKSWSLGMAALVLAGAGVVAPAAVPTLTATLSVVSIPSTITLCRDPAAANAADAQWQLFVDVDDNAATGDPYGNDALILVSTTFQPSPCVAHTANTQDSLVAGVLKWDSNQAGFVDSGAPASVVIDTSAGTLTVTTDVAGPLATLGSGRPLRVAAVAPYTASGNVPSLAGDGVLSTIGAQTTDPAQDVQSCTTPCTQTASWIKVIDIIGVATETSEPLPAFGADTLTVEFDLASLPANLSLCRYPALFANSQGNDYAWLAGFDVDGNPSTGLGGIDTQIVISSTAQLQACSTHSTPIATALTADLEVWDEQQQIFVATADLPLTIDLATGRLFVQADKTSQGLAGLSSTSLLAEQTVGFYTPADPPFAYDQSALLQLGAAYTDPLHDVLNCTSPCSTAIDWYPQIDLVGGSIHLADVIFGNGFE